jgi:hypothetical protein
VPLDISAPASVFNEGVVLNAPVVPGAVGWQWYKNGIAIAGASATTSSYTVPTDGSGTYLVAITYTDANSTQVTVNSAERIVGKTDNGSALLSGSITSSNPSVFEEGVTLTAPGVLNDPDGNNTTPNYAYQWYRNGVAINGAISSTYDVPLNAAGSYKVSVTYTDAQEHRVTLNSSEQAVEAIDNGSGTAGSITSSTPDIFLEGVTLRAPAVSGDPDGDSASPNYAYQWFEGVNPITGATASTYTVPPLGQGTYKVKITYTDAQGTRNTVYSPNQVVAASDNGTGTAGAITVDPGLAFQEGVILNAPVVTSDPDGTTSSYAYQWYRDGIAIAGATTSSYRVPLTGVGTYKVALTYTDAQNSRVTLYSPNAIVAKFNNGNASIGSITSSTEGIFKEGVSLIAPAVSGDPDGNSTTPSYTYQWYRNGIAIDGAIDSTYDVPLDAAGSYKVSVTYTDAQNYRVTLVSSERPVEAIDNGNGTAASISSSTPGVFREGVTLQAPVVSGDPDGDSASPTYAYQWFKDGRPVDGATDYNYLVEPGSYGTYKVAITYTDAQGISSTVDSPEQFVEAINTGNGTPQSITSSRAGSFIEGVSLNAPVVIGDPDGDSANPNYTYQWFRNGDAIIGATNAAYTVPTAGAGSYRVAISYTDAKQIRSTVNSLNQDVVTGERTFTPSASANRATATDYIVDRFRLQSNTGQTSPWRISEFNNKEDFLQITAELSANSLPRSLFAIEKIVIPERPLTISEQKSLRKRQKGVSKSIKRMDRTGDGFVYNQLTGQLFADTNGSKKGFGVGGGLIAVLEDTPALGINNFQFL